MGEPPRASSVCPEMTERKFKVLGRFQGDTDLTGKVPNMPTTGIGGRSQLQ